MKRVERNVPVVDLITEESRSKQAVLLSNLFDRWKLSTEDQLNLLGLSSTSRSMLGKYRKGDPLSSSRDIQDRAGWLFAIHKALRLLFPRNPELRYSWISRRNRAFDNLAPVDLMKDEGLIGIAKVARYLDFQRGQ